VQVVVLDLNQARIDAWNSDNLPIYEPGLDEVVKACRGRNLFFSTDTLKHIAEGDVIFVRCGAAHAALRCAVLNPAGEEPHPAPPRPDAAPAPTRRGLVGAGRRGPRPPLAARAPRADHAFPGRRVVRWRTAA
jgi:hypothetical protein